MKQVPTEPVGRPAVSWAMGAPLSDRTVRQVVAFLATVVIGMPISQALLHVLFRFLG